MIIDCHCHLFDTNSSEEYFNFADEPDGLLGDERYMSHALAEAVDFSVVSANPDWLLTPEGLADANERVARVVAAHPDRLGGLCQLNPHFPGESLAQMDAHIAKGNLVGVGELCQYVLDHDTDDARMFPLIERAIELDVTVLQHASSADHTEGLDKLAGMFPKARFVMAHMGGMYNWPKGLEVAARHENIWVDTSGFVMLCFGAMERAVAKLGPGRIVFGVDFPLVKAGPLVAALEQLGLSPEDHDRIAWKNAAELFKLDV